MMAGLQERVSRSCQKEFPFEREAKRLLQDCLSSFLSKIFKV
jgi:histone H3/H4